MHQVTATLGKHPRPQPTANENEDNLSTKKPRIENTQTKDLSQQPETEQRITQLRQRVVENTETNALRNAHLNHLVRPIEMPQFPLSPKPLPQILPRPSHTYTSMPPHLSHANAAYSTTSLPPPMLWAPSTVTYISLMMQQFPLPTYPVAQQPFIHPYLPMPSSVLASPGGYSTTTTSSHTNDKKNGDFGYVTTPRYDAYEQGNTIPFIEPRTPLESQNQTSRPNSDFRFPLDGQVNSRLDFQTLNELISQSKSLYRRNDYDSALGTAEIVLQNDPFNLMGLICKSKALHGLGRYDASLITAEMVLKLDPNNAMGLICKAEALRGLCMYPESLTTVNEFLKIKPASLKGLICKIDVLYYLDRPSEYLHAAKDLLRKASELIKRGRYDDSRNAANWVLMTIPEDDPTNCDSQILQQYRLIKSLGLIYKSEASRHLGKLIESLDCADMALALGIDFNRRIAFSCKKEALIAIVDALITGNKLIEALPHIDSILAFDPNSLQALKRKFKILKALDQLPAAAAVGAHAIAVCNARVEASMNSLARQPGNGQAAHQELLAVQAKWTKMIDQLQKEIEAIQRIENEILMLKGNEGGDQLQEEMEAMPLIDDETLVNKWIEEGERLRNEKEEAQQLEDENLVNTWLE